MSREVTIICRCDRCGRPITADQERVEMTIDNRAQDFHAEVCLEAFLVERKAEQA